jgi:hypothetical protein
MPTDEDGLPVVSIVGPDGTELAMDTSAIGATNDAKANVDGNGSVIAQLRRLTTDLAALTTAVGDLDVNQEALETLATALNGFVDGLETLIGSTNTKLDTLTTNIGDLDVNQEAIEVLIASTNTKLDTLTTAMGDVDVNLEALEAEAIRTISTHVSTDIDETDQDVKGSAGQVHGWHLYNDAAAEVYVFIYNTNSPTVGTTTPLIRLILPPNSGANMSLPRPVAFGTAISVAALTGPTSGNPAASQVSGTVFYS